MEPVAAALTDLTVAASIAFAEERLSGSHGDNPRLEAEILLALVLGKPRSYVRAWPEQRLAHDQRERLLELITRRAAGVPIAYLTGQREFWSLTLAVNEHTLIPRPETERLVELALERIPITQSQRIADIGTGSGAIALAVATERPHCHVIATDISLPALAVSRENAARLAIRNVEFRAGDALVPLHGERLDMICSNPPYLAEGDPHLNEGDLPAEPRNALVAGSSGLEIIETIARGALRNLSLGGWLLLEHGYNQGDAVTALLVSLGYREVMTERDYSGQPRISLGRRG